MVFGRKRPALLPILVTQALLMFLVGHNLAILGLVDIPTDQLYRVFEFVGLTAFLAAAFAVSALVMTLVRSSRALHTEFLNPETTPNRHTDASGIAAKRKRSPE